MNKLREFQEHVTQAFQFLESYGFVQTETEARGVESYVLFARDNEMLITIGYTVGDDPWVAVTFPRVGRRTSLTKLAKEAGVSAPRPALSMRDNVFHLAETLRAYFDSTKRNEPAR